MRGGALLGFEILFVIFVAYFTWEEGRELCKEGWQEYKKDKWNLLRYKKNICVLCVLYCALTF